MAAVGPMFYWNEMCVLISRIDDGFEYRRTLGTNKIFQTGKRKYIPFLYCLVSKMILE